MAGLTCNTTIEVLLELTKTDGRYLFTKYLFCQIIDLFSLKVKSK